jgi:hypothetical protein
VYEVKASASLYSFHKQMRADMDFPQDQVVLFKSFDAAGNVAARYSVFTDFGFGTIDHVTMAECLKRGEEKFIYFYDTTNVKSVIVFGRMELIDDMEQIVDITRRLSLKFIQDEEHIRKEIEGSAHRTLLMKLVPEHICGKLVSEF